MALGGLVTEDRFPGKALFRGKPAFGPQVIDLAGRARVAQGGDPEWERLTPGDWKLYARPPRLPMDRAGVVPGPPASSHEEVLTVLKGLLGGEEEKVFDFKPHSFSFPATLYVAVRAKTLADRVDLGAVPMLPLLIESLGRAFEVWISYERNRETGETVQRMRIFKGIAAGDGERYLVAAEAEKGEVTAFLAVPPSDHETVNHLRFGRLAWRR
jgi:hypothetical protein